MSSFTRLVRLALAASAAACATLAEAAVVEQIFQFSSYVAIENSIMRPNGNILFSTLGSGNLYSLDLLADAPQAEIVASMPGATALTGFARVGADKYAVAGGVRGSYQYTNETIYTIDFSADAKGTVAIAAKVPDAVLLNGLAALSGADAILITDSRLACLWRVDLATGASEKVFESADLAAPAGVSVPIGANGLKIRAGYAYLTNTATGVFGRVPIDAASGKVTGEFETVAVVPTATSWDDFDMLADDGEVLACQSPNSVVYVSAAGDVTTAAGADAAEPKVLGCSSVIVVAGDGTVGQRTAYVATKGDSASGIGGQILMLTGV